jgi:hypothetical protein
MERMKSGDTRDGGSRSATGGMGLKRFLFGDQRTIAGTVYGTIIVLAVLAAGGRAYVHQLWRLLTLAGGSAVVLWLAHVYAHGLGESLGMGRRLTLGELRSIARREAAVVLAAVPPLAAIALGAAGVFEGRTAVWIALGIGVVTLAAQGVRYSRLEQLSPLATTITIGLNLAMGLALVALEVLIAH